MNLGREKLPWSEEVWNRIDQAVHNECERTKIAKKFLPLYGPVAPGELTKPSDTVLVDDVLNINEAAVVKIVELQVEFTLTPQQVEREEELMTAVTLATRATNLLSQAEDVVIFQGQSAIDGKDGPQHPLFRDGKVRAKSGPAGIGLLNAPEQNDDPQIQIVSVPLTTGRAEGPARYGENTFGAIAEAYSRLQSGTNLAQAHYGPYACVLNYIPYADTYAPLPVTLIITADRIKPLMTAGFYGTGTLPGNVPRVDLGNRGEEIKPKGIVISLGGNTVDLVVGMDSITAFLQEDTEGRHRFRVYERFALRLKDTSAIMRLEFE